MEEITSLTYDLRGIHDNASATAFSEGQSPEAWLSKVHYIALTVITIKDHTSDVNRFFAT